LHSAVPYLDHFDEELLNKRLEEELLGARDAGGFCSDKIQRHMISRALTVLEGRAEHA
jgi:hypothetical protein